MCFLSQVFAAALLLSLTAGAPTPECDCECAHLNKTLSTEELEDAIFGKWILHESYVLSSDDDLIKKLHHPVNSKADVIHSENNHTFSVKHTHKVNETCIRYSVNYTIVGNTIQTVGANGSAETDFLKTCDGCMMMRNSAVTCTGVKVTFLLFYTNSTILPQADQEAAHKQAKCLGFPQPSQFIYEQTELCPEESDDATAKDPEQ